MRSLASQMIKAATISWKVKATRGVTGLKQCLYRDPPGRVQLERERANEVIVSRAIGYSLSPNVALKKSSDASRAL
jgi:hypothetical protein